jgi:serine/threonine-protein kinase
MSDQVSLTAALADRYAIQGELGRGGMATVFLARDLRHDRRVAVKVLNPELGAVLGVERFLAEIRVTANLQHPNLLPLFDSGEAGGQLFYVMPFVEGESLRARLEREKQLPVDEAIRISVAVANALEYAHGLGVIHRDLKPENILLQAGQPVVADFGIALAVSKAGGTRVTQTGLSLGTPQYMSPEQATADRVIDSRSDIYSLAAVTYEMLAGEAPLAGPTAQAIIARLLTERPRPIREHRPTVPEHVEAVLERALEKLPADRIATAREFADALSGRTGVATTHRRATRPPARGRLAVAAPWVIAIAAAIAAIRGWTRPSAGAQDDPVVRYELSFPPAQRPASALIFTGATLAVSPNGRQFVFSVADSAGTHLELRGVNELRGQPLSGGKGGRLAEFSPDGSWIAFVSEDSKLKKVAVRGGGPITLCDLPTPSGLTWISNESIAFSRLGGMVDRGMWRVSASGGEPVRLTSLDSTSGEVLQWSPRTVPGGRYVLYTSVLGSLTAGHVGVASVETGVARAVKSLPASYVLGYQDGRVIFVRADGTVHAARLDLRTGTAGDPVPIMDSVAVFLSWAAAALSPSGTLITTRGYGLSRVVMVDQRGLVTPLIEQVRAFAHPKFSPDGRRLALTIGASGGSDIWLYDTVSRSIERVTTDRGSDRAEWTPDGRRLVYSANRRQGRYGLWWQSVDASDEPEALYSTDNPIREVSVGPDGIAFREDTPGRARDILYLKLADRKVSTVVSTPADDLMPRVSRDGKWLAYISDESGNYEVYVRPFPGGGGRVAVSTGGGTEPVWAPDSRAIYYRNGTKLMVASVVAGPGNRFVIGDRRQLFEGAYAGHPYHQNYDVTRDGKSFVMIQPDDQDRKVVVIMNWMAEVRRQLATAKR